uniref:PDEase domain-containing protein n=1 Tax=Chromera velia CCMP2878 TaxID=1169474 RepID=A0A0G4I568_9ALVE|eukprot:Cvel_1820.t1-p1 / transcript=Cvel_1820.t1 / gene=Cvel_1820 / organism=Chromera_velia_CCMP2878 / gene_product=cAMP-specific 3',5'-cyclic phosphodiesterase,, putative / transcript_product=cAMP-specific 3',5'-cyclic phosphodiesterase,, putative / location=Cvel_scaffold67:57829-67344(+) / protein_length=997 / sequence_SO=supercontig / SO=protein_coding / is_pseudo=false
MRDEGETGPSYGCRDGCMTQPAKYDPRIQMLNNPQEFARLQELLKPRGSSSSDPTGQVQRNKPTIPNSSEMLKHNLCAEFEEQQKKDIEKFGYPLVYNEGAATIVPPGIDHLPLNVPVAPYPVDEKDRMTVLDSYKVFPSDLHARQGEQNLDSIAQAAQLIFQTKFAFINMIGKDVQFVKANIGLPDEVFKTARGDSYCQHVVATRAPLFVNDAKKDRRFTELPVTAALDIEFYMGVPIISVEGFVLGSLCVIDNRLRPDLFQNPMTEYLLERFAATVSLHLVQRRDDLTEREQIRLDAESQRARRADLRFSPLSPVEENEEGEKEAEMEEAYEREREREMEKKEKEKEKEAEDEEEEDMEAEDAGNKTSRSIGAETARSIASQQTVSNLQVPEIQFHTSKQSVKDLVRHLIDTLSATSPSGRKGLRSASENGEVHAFLAQSILPKIFEENGGRRRGSRRFSTLPRKGSAALAAAVAAVAHSAELIRGDSSSSSNEGSPQAKVDICPLKRGAAIVAGRLRASNAEASVGAAEESEEAFEFPPESLKDRHRNLKKKKNLMDLIANAPAIPQAVRGRQLLSDVHCWGFNIHKVVDAVGGPKSALVPVASALLSLQPHFPQVGISKARALKLFSHIQDCYSPVNQYHNAAHGADVLQGAAVLSDYSPLAGVFNEVQRTALYLASAAHDINHPGLTSGFLLNVEAELALLYNDMSVLENMHSAVLFTVMRSLGVDLYDSLTPLETRKEMRKTIVSLIMATDLAKSSEYIAKMRGVFSACDLQALAETPALPSPPEDEEPLPEQLRSLLSESPEHALSMLQMILKICDVGHPAKPMKQHERWTALCHEEFWSQGDIERELGLPISPLCDRNAESAKHPAAGQIGFMTFVVSPILLPFCRVTRFAPPLDHFARNFATWERRKERMADGQRAGSRRTTSESVPSPSSQVRHTTRHGSRLYMVQMTRNGSQAESPRGNQKEGGPVGSQQFFRREGVGSRPGSRGV